MRLNSAMFNGRRINVGTVVYPVTFASDSVGVVDSALDATRYANVRADAVAQLDCDLLASAQRWLRGDLSTLLDSDLVSRAVRGGAGSGVVECDGGLYYTKIVYLSGAAELRIIAISDVGVVYGEGSGVALPSAALDGSRVRLGYGDAMAETDAGLAASAIRTPATAYVGDIVSLTSQLDTAHITAGGIRYIDGFGDAYAYLEIEDGGMRRQVFIGSLDLEPLATGFATARRHGKGDATIKTSTSFTLESIRRGTGTAVVQGVGELAGEIFVLGRGDAVISLVARLTGAVYMRGSVLSAVSTLATELEGVRSKIGVSSAIAVTVTDMTGVRKRTGRGSSIITLAAESSASDVNFVGMDDDVELFYRPPMQREFFRAAITREWRRL